MWHSSCSKKFLSHHTVIYRIHNSHNITQIAPMPLIQCRKDNKAICRCLAAAAPSHLHTVAISTVTTTSLGASACNILVQHAGCERQCVKRDSSQSCKHSKCCCNSNVRTVPAHTRESRITPCTCWCHQHQWCFFHHSTHVLCLCTQHSPPEVLSTASEHTHTLLAALQLQLQGQLWHARLSLSGTQQPAAGCCKRWLQIRAQQDSRQQRSPANDNTRSLLLLC